MLVQSTLLVILLLGVECQEPPRVKVKQGVMEGSEMTTFKGKPFLAFRGIPYAKPPIGPLRFKLPEPGDPWKGILNATEDGPVCPQFDEHSLQPTYRGQEDCLILNVYTPKKISNKLPVMVFVHGGAFVSGYSTTEGIGPRRLMDKDIIFVAMNYRLGPLGFLSTEDSASVGNFGLWDQRLALQWVQENIEAFGGDPSLVTLFGESAGAASVSLHLISPASKGLFHRLIAESGSSLCHWAVQRKALKNAQRLAKDLDCPTTPTDKLVECLRGVDPEALIKAASSYSEVSILPIAFAPTVDQREGAKFLPDLPLKLFMDGKINPVPVISGINAHEGLLFGFPEVLKMKAMTEECRKKRFDSSLSYFGNINISDVPKVVKLYMEDFPLDFDDPTFFYSYIEAISDGLFIASNEETVQQLSKTNNSVYMYRMEQQVNALSNLKQLILGQEITGVVHGEELFLLFNNVLVPQALEGDDSIYSEKFIDMWINFAKYGNPTPKEGTDVGVTWDPAVPGQRNYLRLKLPLEMEYSPPSEKLKFWNDLWTRFETDKALNEQL